MEPLTPEERAAVARFLARPPRGRGRVEYLAGYLVWVVPSFLFALYGFSRRDFLAVAFAYLLLLIAVVYIAVFQSRIRVLFYSALKKYDDYAMKKANAAQSQATGAAPASDGVGV